MSDTIASDYFFVLGNPSGQIRFGGSDGRPWDERHHYTFSVQIDDHPLLHGEWEPVWVPDGNSFDAIVLDFGLRDSNDAGNPDAVRVSLNKERGELVEQLIRALFASAPARRGVMPFISDASFRGNVTFRPGWIRS